MSTFTKHKTSADRSATDRSRHKKKIEKAIREGIYHIVSDESIIGQDGKKKIKIPVKGIKEYNIGHFLVGESIFLGMSKTIKKFKKILNS